MSKPLVNNQWEHRKEDKKNVFYFVGKNQKVTYEPNFVHTDHYQNEIKISEIQNILNKTHLREEKTFDDWYDYIGENIAIGVMLPDKGSYWDEDGSITYEEYLSKVNNLYVIIEKIPDQKDLAVIEHLMKHYGWHLLEPSTQTHIFTTQELLKFFEKNPPPIYEI